ncbi:MAG: Secretion system C-terminal sorting domain, partial [Bacteroidota bacterium]
VYVYGYGGVYSTSCYTLTANTSGTAFFGNSSGTEVADGEIFILDHPNASKAVANGFYPNPASTVLNIAQTANAAGEQLFTLYDLSGRQVFVKTLALQEGDNFITMDLPELQNGVYFVRLGEGKIQRLIIQK